jgi:F0F1-type ATP synthase assembly protein I
MAPKPEDDSGIAKSLRDVGPYLGLGLQLAATIVVFVLVGGWLDKKYTQKYIFTLIAGLLGIGIGLYNLIKTLAYLEKRNKTENEKK